MYKSVVSDRDKAVKLFVEDMDKQIKEYEELDKEIEEFMIQGKDVEYRPASLLLGELWGLRNAMGALESRDRLAKYVVLNYGFSSENGNMSLEEVIIKHLNELKEIKQY